MSWLSSMMGGSKKKAAIQAQQQQQQLADQQGNQMAALSQQQADADQRLGRARRATRGRRLLRYAQGAAGTMGL